MNTAQLIHALKMVATECPGRVRGRGEVIGDISCDVNVSNDFFLDQITSKRSLRTTIQGGLEFLPHTSTLSAPFFYHHVNSDAMVQIMAVDILPTSIPRDSSIAFSDVLLPYVRQLINGYRPITDDAKRRLGSYVQEKEDIQRERGEALERATVTRDGTLAPRFAWLKEHVDAWRTRESLKEKVPENVNEFESRKVDVNRETQNGVGATGALGFGKKKRVLMLGSGMVAGPAVHEIAKRGDVELVIGIVSFRVKTIS
jgi:alpha-aminoadipic semialdehyde synthase